MAAGTSILRMGTRGSPLALTQSRQVAANLERVHPGLKVEEVIIKTTGDKITDVPLAKIGGKGLFIKEIEEALSDGRCDFAVHSMKDVPGELPRGFAIGCVPKREDPRDAFCSRGVKFEDLPPTARIGTSSLRRRSQLRVVRPKFAIEDLRGNVDTRLKRLDEGRFDAIVLAAAGLRRLGLAARITEYVPTDVLLPAVGQGALALEIREGDENTARLLLALEDETTRIATTAERAFLRRLEGGCQVPIAGHATVSGGTVVLNSLVADLEGKRVLRKKQEAATGDAESLGLEVAEEILKAGGREILAEIYAAEGN